VALTQFRLDLGRVVACIQGDTVHNMDAVAQALAQHAVPAAWRIYWTDSSVLAWAKEIHRRVNFMRKATLDVREV